MKVLAKVFFDVDGYENMYLVGEEFIELARDNGWVVNGGSIKEEYIEDAKKLAKEIAIKNETTASVTIYGTREDGRFNPSDKKGTYEI